MFGLAYKGKCGTFSNVLKAVDVLRIDWRLSLCWTFGEWPVSFLSVRSRRLLVRACFVFDTRLASLPQPERQLLLRSPENPNSSSSRRGRATGSPFRLFAVRSLRFGSESCFSFYACGIPSRKKDAPFSRDPTGPIFDHRSETFYESENVNFV